MSEQAERQTIAFLSNQTLTPVQKMLADRLEQQGYRCVWLVPGRRWDRWLAEHGVPDTHRLALHALTESSKQLSLASAKRIARQWEQENRPPIAALLRMDRLMRDRPAQRGWQILAAYGQAIEKFLKEQNVVACFGEQTWAWEMLTALIARQQGRGCYFYSTVRIPSERWGLFEPITHQLIHWRTAGEADRAWADGFLPAWRARPVKPFYAASHPSALTFRRYWWDELSRRFGPNSDARSDITVRPPLAALKDRLRLAWNAARLRLFSPFEPAPAEGRFVLFCLHHAPEASIDVFGAPHSDQAHLLRRLSRLLPATHELWVKEHPDWLGDRSPAWLRAIAALPNVRLIDPAASTFALLQRADLVVSITGTVGYEAALMGRPAVGLAPLFFDPLMRVSAADFPDPLLWPMTRLLTPPTEAAAQRHEAECRDFLARLHANSFDGFPDRLARQTQEGRENAADIDTIALGLQAFLQSAHPRA
ncbi:hypothetical protein VZ95_09540 [Elstera litoralis]|uniref:Capsule polysaccharide biosynthesis protein n=1 Tax=Elstera litoralis TaxID=552518 RepID=A0A0F3IVX5_9PROT|nr:hypothetical protein [Elstera litoralis]KJV09749.1 hypothetical protein VZ95_09540 [Elstera litoralis]